MRRARRLAAWALIVLATSVMATAIGLFLTVRASLPQLDGQLMLAGLTARATVERDDLGIPTIRGATREDVARATGFVHAQDRFFQMDLARRRAAGELSALVGARALQVDGDIRIHRFRDEARRAVAFLPADHRRVLDAYVSGVNAGLAALRSRPFEYLLLRQVPQPWQAEDTLLVILSMFVTLQESDGAFESTLATMQAVLPQQMVDFLLPAGTEWDTPVVGDRLASAPIPDRGAYDLRSLRRGIDTKARPARPRDVAWLDAEEHGEAIGSNNWAVDSHVAADGGALVANDMHLAIRVPNTWYRARLEWRGTDGTRTLIGITLPGVPALVVGSNTEVAWGFTNSYSDTSDIVLLDLDPSRPGEYRTPDGWKRFVRFNEAIDVAGGATETLPVDWTIWGPVLPTDFLGRARAYRWVAYSAERLGASILQFESARTVDDALNEANGLGTPAQNMVVADRSGAIGWTIDGAIPRREGLDGRFPTSWSDGTRQWNGWLTPAEYPRVVNPSSGRLWTANARVVDGPLLTSLGDGNWEVGSRARIIRERLFARAHFSARDLLAIQMDVSAEFLERWRRLMLETLTPQALADVPGRQALRAVLEREWNGEAAPDSAGYRLTRMFRDAVSERVFSFVLAECYERDRTFDYSIVRRREGPLWTLVTTKPEHLLDPAFATWDDLLLATMDGIVGQLTRDGNGDLSRRVWSEMNVTAYHHPLSGALPFLGRWLDMPQRSLPGDLYTPQMHWGPNGASERMVVSPGREADGIMHMPTGQSGNPLSPFYSNSHEAWADGRPTPFLPGATAHTLTLAPQSP